MTHAFGVPRASPPHTSTDLPPCRAQSVQGLYSRKGDAMFRSTAAARFALTGLMLSAPPWALGQTSSGGVPALKEELIIEIDRAKGQEKILKDNALVLEMKAIDEEMIRKEADVKFDLAIIATKEEVSFTKLDLFKEIDRAKAAETGILGDFTLKLSNEAATRAAADANLVSTINGVSSALAQEVTRATGAEATLTSTLSGEVARAQAAEATLTTNLNNEI